MKGERKYWFSQKFEVKNIDGHLITMYVLSDLTDQELAKALAYFTEREDFEYCAALVAEADLRGIKLKTKINNE